MSNIDWMTLGLAAEADRQAAEAKKAQGELRESMSALSMRDCKIAILERKLAEAEDELRHSKSQIAGFIASLRLLIDEIKSCPEGVRDKLLVCDDDGKRPIDYAYTKAYEDHWEEYRIPHR